MASGNQGSAAKDPTLLKLGGAPRMGLPGPAAEAATEVERLCADLERDAMKGLWTVQGRSEALSDIRPHVWTWKKIQAYLDRAGSAMSLEDSPVRRALMLWNPGAKDHWDATNTLTAAVQMMLPGEKVITHRHIHSALRFITHGSGATTTVNGGKITLSAGDLVLTPNWAWHDHANESDEPIIWMDGVDRPLVKMLDAVYFDVYRGHGYQPVVKNEHEAGFQTDLDGLDLSRYSPKLVYRWEEAQRALDEIEARNDISPYDDVLFKYSNPVNGGPITPTMGADIQRLRPGVHTRAHRHTNSAVYHVYRGSGHSIIDGERFDWEEGDYFVLPSRVWHEHVNGSSTDAAVLFSINDRPAYESLGLYREEALETGNGFQA